MSRFIPEIWKVSSKNLEIWRSEPYQLQSKFNFQISRFIPEIWKVSFKRSGNLEICHPHPYMFLSPGPEHLSGIWVCGGKLPYIYIYTYLYLYTIACIYTYIYGNACTCIRITCMYLCVHACMYVCTYVCMYVFMYVCKYACMYVCACIYTSGPSRLNMKPLLRLRQVQSCAQRCCDDSL